MRALILFGVVVAAVGVELRSPLIEAAMNDDAPAVRSLLGQKIDVNAAAADGTTALDWAVRANDAPLAPTGCSW